MTSIESDRSIQDQLSAEIKSLQAKNKELAERLAESEQTLKAIQSGEVDAILISTENGEQIYTLRGAEEPYRILFEQMNEGAVTISEDGSILYSNQSFASVMKISLETVIGTNLASYIHPTGTSAFRELLDQSISRPVRSDVVFVARDGTEVPMQLSISFLETATVPTYCIVAADLTERIKAEVALRAAYEGLEQKVQERTKDLSDSETKFHQMFANSLQNIGIYEMVYDGSGEIVDWVVVGANQALERQLGMSIESMKGKCATELWGFEASADGIARSREIMSSGIGQQFEIDWGGRHYLASYFPIGRNRLAAVGNDITGRKKAEEALLQSQRSELARREELEALMDAVPATIWISRDAAGADIIGNRAVQELLGVPSGVNVSETAPLERRQQHFFAYRNGEAILPEHLPMQEAGLTGKAVLGYEFELRFANGRSVWLYGNAVPLHDEAGSTRGAVGAFVDITERKWAEDALRQSEKTYRSIGELIPFGIWTTDAQGQATYISPSFCELVGKSEEEILKFGWLDTLDPDTVERTISDWKKSIGSGDFWNYTHRIMGKDGQYHYVLARGVPIKDDKGKVLSWAGVNIDITEQMRNEENLARSNAELQQFAYVASHDLQEPLRMIMSYLALLNKKYGNELNDQAKGYMAYVNAGAGRMRELINDLLLFSRIDTRGKEFTAVDMNRLAEKAIDTLHLSINESKAVVTLEPLPIVIGDEMQLSQVLQNLVSNAIKFHGPEAPRIDVTSRESAREWTIAVSDNGIGIDPKYYDKLFHMFQRLHTREDYPGTGIGLAISKKIVERHRGRIWVRSDGKNGSTFYFTIPKTRGETR